jgi:microcystin-dependent protein
MSDPYIAEIKLISFNFAPRGWAFCNGQLLPISQNQALFSLIGTTYGGDGRTTFALPNLQGRVPIHVGGGFLLGESAGEQAHTLVSGELPQHTHRVSASTADASVSSPAGARAARAATTNFASPGTPALLDPTAFGAIGGGQPHDNMSPYLVLNFVIALVGIFPSRS